MRTQENVIEVWLGDLTSAVAHAGILKIKYDMGMGHDIHMVG